MTAALRASVVRLIDALSAEPPDYETARLAALAAYEEMLEQSTQDIVTRRVRRRADRKTVDPDEGGREIARYFGFRS